MQAMIEWAEEVNAKAIEKVQSKQKREFDAKHKPPTFQVGDKVWIYNSWKDMHSTGEKLEWNWQHLWTTLKKGQKGSKHDCIG